MDPGPDRGRHSAQFLIESQPTCADGVHADNMYTLVRHQVLQSQQKPQSVLRCTQTQTQLGAWTDCWFYSAQTKRQRGTYISLLLALALRAVCHKAVGLGILLHQPEWVEDFNT